MSEGVLFFRLLEGFIYDLYIDDLPDDVICDIVINANDTALYS